MTEVWAYFLKGHHASLPVMSHTCLRIAFAVAKCPPPLCHIRTIRFQNILGSVLLVQLLTSIYFELNLINQFVHHIPRGTLIHAFHVICTGGGALGYISGKPRPLPSVILRPYDSFFIDQIIKQPRDLLMTSIFYFKHDPSSK